MSNMTPGIARLLNIRTSHQSPMTRAADGLAATEDALEEIVANGGAWAEAPLESVRQIITRMTVRTHIERLAERHSQ